MVWFLEELELDTADAVRAVLRGGEQVVEFVADLELGDRHAVLSGLHVYGPGPNSLGIAGLRELIRWAMEQLDVDELRIEGATRTSGASPGRRPTPLVFR
jgi:hypothetical protein